MAKSSATPKELHEVCQRFESWRNSHVGRARIPEPLWKAAVESATEHGVWRTARALHLEYNKLRRLTDSAGTGEHAVAATKPRSPFVELVAPASTGTLDCVIELEGPRGKLRIEWKGTTPPDLAGLSRSLWEAA